MQETQQAWIQHLLNYPQEISSQYTTELQRLSQLYPASNLVLMLLVKSSQNQPDNTALLNKAAIYSADRTMLFHLIHQPEKLFKGNEIGEVEVVEIEVPEEVESVKEEGKSEIVDLKPESQEADFTEENVEEGWQEDKSEIENLKPEILKPDFTKENIKEFRQEDKSEISNSKSEIEDEVFDEIAETPFAFINRESDLNIADGESSQVAAETGEINDETFEEINEASFIDVKTDNVAALADGESPQTAAETGRIDEETFEEINEASFINIKRESAAFVTDGESPQAATETGRIDEEIFEEITETPFTEAKTVNPESELITSDIPSLESFHIDSVIPSLEELPSENTLVSTPPEQSKTQPSRYHDEKMPYSFMWWLDKTRQEHAQTYQPYASPFRPDTSAQIETAPAAKEPLEQQYIEHIFHLRSVEELEQSTTQPQTVPFAVDKKETKIIEKFIREEPQISTPRPEKLDVENKARKSTEDKLDMVSETLAKIYTEQMLYHKAIDTYQKLRLKYPDKSGYFAARIDELEQKIR